jgi:hypothetical protein
LVCEIKLDSVPQSYRVFDKKNKKMSINIALWVKELRGKNKFFYSDDFEQMEQKLFGLKIKLETVLQYLRVICIIKNIFV